MSAACPLKRLESQGMRGVRDLRRVPAGAQQHTRRHVARPKRHRLSEDADIEPRDRTQVGRHRNTVGSCTDDGNVAFGH